MRLRHFDFFSLLSYLLLFLVAGVVVLHFVFGFQYVVILTDSMKPSINPGDLVITKPVDPSELRVGDVILYEVHIGGNTYRITHRIVEIKTDPSGRYYLVTKGDNRKYADPWNVYPEQVLGKVVLVIHTVGVLWYYTPMIVLALFLFVIASLAYDLALELLKEKPPLPKSRKAHLLLIRRKKVKLHYHKR
ncbi:signal peptidase I [Thermococcus sp.]|uniref:signal peptidase I n=1 Tax=Thermococcus sp. TaxID=35749 RepID=UPI002629FB70|nr:signal peptidase I [Thermococcus sp.]